MMRLKVSGEHGAVFRVGDELFDQPKFREVPQHMGNHKLPLVFLGHRHDPISVVQGQCNGLFQ